MTKQKLLKSLLATVSMVGALAFVTTNASADGTVHWAIKNNAPYSENGALNNKYWRGSNPQASDIGGPGNGDWIILDGAYNIVADKGANIPANLGANRGANILSLDVNGYGGQTLTVTGGIQTSIGSIVDSSGGGNNTINIAFDLTPGNQMTLTGSGNAAGTAASSPIAANTYTGLGSVNLNNTGTLLMTGLVADLSNVKIYGNGTLRVFGAGGTAGNVDAGNIQFGGTIGLNARAATATTIKIKAGDGANNGTAAGSTVILDSINTTSNVDLIAGNGQDVSGATNTGNGGDINVSGSIISSSDIIFKPGDGGSNRPSLRPGPENAGVGNDNAGGVIGVGNDNAGGVIGVGNGAVGGVIGVGNGAVGVEAAAGNAPINGGPGIAPHTGNAGNGGNVIVAGLLKATNNANIFFKPGLEGLNNGGSGTKGSMGSITTGEIAIEGAGYINVGNNLKITIGGSITGTANQPVLNLAGGSNTTIDSNKSDIIITGQIVPSGDGGLQLNFGGANSIRFNDSVTVAEGGSIVFTSNNIYQLNNASFTGPVVANSNPIIDTTLGDGIFNGPVTANNGMVINLGANTLTFDNDSAIGSLLDGAKNGNITINVTETDGNIVVAEGKTLNMSNAASMNITVSGNALEASLIQLFNARAKLNLPTLINTTSGWSFNNDGTYKLTANFAPTPSTTSDPAPTPEPTREVVRETIFGQELIGTGPNIEALNSLISNATPQEKESIAAQLNSPANGAAIEITINNTILFELLPQLLETGSYSYYVEPLVTPDNDADEGVSAGEARKSHGIWASGSGFIGKSSTGRIKGRSGSKTKTIGSSLGLDTKLSEHWMAGVAFTQSQSNTIMRNSAIGTKYNAKSVIATIYGLYNINKNWSMRGSVSYGQTTNRNNSLRLVRLRDTRAVARSQYDSKLISPEVSLNYRKALSKTTTFSSNLGVQYTYSTTTPYRESGAAPTNQKVRTKPKAGIWSGTFGLGLGSMFKVADISVMPEIHASFRRALRGQNPTTLIQFDGMSGFFTVKSKPTRKVAFGVGGSITVSSSGPVSLGIGYDASLSEKTIGHRGSLRLKVSF